MHNHTLPPTPEGMTGDAWSTLCAAQVRWIDKQRSGKADTSAALGPVDTAVAYQMGEALVTTRSMEAAIRTIMQPLYESAEAYTTLCAVEACLEKMMREVDAAVDAWEAAQAARLIARESGSTPQ